MTCAEIRELSPLYISGELDAQRMFKFAAHLESCSDCQLDQRVRASILSEEIDTSRVELAIRERIRHRHVPGWIAAAAAVIAMVSASALSYRIFHQEQTPPICVAAAQDHQREIVQGEPRPWLSDISAIQSLAEKRGVPASAITALDTTGYRLERARLCFLKKQIFLHLVYTKDGAEFSVYLRPRGSESAFGDSVHQTEVGPEELAYFQSDRLTAVFVVHQPRPNAGADVLAFARAGARVL
jgi:anti-sigma factor RsiW